MDELEKSIDEVSNIFDDANAQIELIIAAAVASGMLNDAAYYNRQKGAILNVLVDAKRKATPLIIDALKKAYVTKSKKTLQWLAAFIGTSMLQPFSAADQRAVELIVQSALGRLDNALGSMGSAADRVMTQQALQEIAALSSANKLDKATNKVEKALARAGVTTNAKAAGQGKLGSRLININGRNFDAKKYSKLVVRTEASIAENQATLQRCLENNWDLVRVSNNTATCRICSPYNGETFSIGGLTPGYDVLDDEPPYHPACTHIVEPTLG